MNRKKYGFTLIEIIVSISIMLTIATIISVTIININTSLQQSKYEAQIFGEVNSLIVDKYEISQYLSGKVIEYSTGAQALIFYNPGESGVLFGFFQNSGEDSNYKLQTTFSAVGKNYLGKFSLTKNQVNSLLSNQSIGKDIIFNKGIIYKNLNPFQFLFQEIGTTGVFQLHFIGYKVFPEALVGQNKELIPFDGSNFSHIVLNF